MNFTLKKNKILLSTFFLTIIMSVVAVSSNQSANDNFSNSQVINSQFLIDRIGHYDCGETVTDVLIDGDYAIVGTMSGEVRIIDCSDLTNPTEVGKFTDDYDALLPEAVEDLLLYGDYLYYFEDNSLVKILDVSDKTNPTIADEFYYHGGSGTYEHAIIGNALLTSGGTMDGFTSYNITEPLSPLEEFNNGTESAMDIFCKDSYAYICSNDLVIYDISNPFSPVYKSQLAHSYFSNLLVGNSYAYCMNGDIIHVIDITDKENLIETNSVSIGGSLRDMKFYDEVPLYNFAIVADYLSGIKIIDITTPSDPTLFATYDDGAGNGYEFEIVDNILYVADGPDGLEILEINFDTDEDGLSDDDENEIYGTNPLYADTDADIMPDGWEIQYGLNPIIASDAYADLDNDKLLNFEEYLNGTDPTNKDTDGDGYKDGREVSEGTDPLDPLSHPVFVWVQWMTIVTISVPAGVLIIVLVVILAVRSSKRPKPVKDTETKDISDKKYSAQPQGEKSSQNKEEDLVQKRLETLKRIVTRYNKIDLERLKNVLEFSTTKELDLWLLSLPDDLEFYVDGNDLVLPQTRFLEDTTYSEKAMNQLELSFKQMGYNCFNCGTPIEKDTRICPDCSHEIIRCAVCKLPVGFGEDLGQCSLCEAQGHLAHMQEWVKTQGKCPQCLQNLPVEGIVPVTPDVKQQKK